MQKDWTGILIQDWITRMFIDNDILIFISIQACKKKYHVWLLQMWLDSYADVQFKTATVDIFHLSMSTLRRYFVQKLQLFLCYDFSTYLVFCTNSPLCTSFPLVPIQVQCIASWEELDGTLLVWIDWSITWIHGLII